MKFPGIPTAKSLPKPLNAEHLLRLFGPRSASARQGTAKLIGLLSSPAYSEMAQAVFGNGFQGRNSARCESALAAQARRIDIAPLHGPALQVLWALKLYYAAIVCGVARYINHDYPDCLDHDLPAEFQSLLQAATEELGNRAEMKGYDDSSVEDLFQPLYEVLIPRPVRHVLGEYYTPPWLVEHVLDQLPLETIPHVRLLDPACGSGAFLLGAIRRLLPLPCPETLPERIRGIDVNPLAVLTARANLALAWRQMGRVESRESRVESSHPTLDSRLSTFDQPILLGDSILGRFENAAVPPESFDLIVGNPPWIAWDNLPEAYREATKPLWRDYGLFSLSAAAARHGGAKKDLSMLMLYAAADRYLKRGGRLAMVITQTLFQTQGAGDGFRRFRLGPDGEPLKILRVDDFVEARPFGDAANWTSVIYLKKGQSTQYPIPYVKWQPSKNPPLPPGEGRGEGSECSAACGFATTARGLASESFHAQPINPQHSTSPWRLIPADQSAGEIAPIGPSQYRAYLGANSGGLNGVFWLEILEKTPEGVRVRNVVDKAKRAVETVETVLEPKLLFPLLRWGELGRYAAAPRLALALVQNPEKRTGFDESYLQQTFPRLYAYLRRFETPLRARAAYRRYQDRGPFYSMYNVGPYTLAPIKVAWRRMDRRMTAAVLAPVTHPLLGPKPKPVIPQETCVLIPCDTVEEAYYLCALLNSAPIDTLIRSMSVRGGKGFGTPRVLDYLSLRRFDPNHPLHARLAALSLNAHCLEEQGKNVGELQREMDDLAVEVQRNK